jgi:hypothetical protein
MAIYREAYNLGSIIKVLLRAIFSLSGAGEGLIYYIMDCFNNNLVYNKVTSDLAESINSINSPWDIY